MSSCNALVDAADGGAVDAADGGAVSAGWRSTLSMRSALWLAPISWLEFAQQGQAWRS